MTMHKELMKNPEFRKWYQRNMSRKYRIMHGCINTAPIDDEFLTFRITGIVPEKIPAPLQEHKTYNDEIPLIERVSNLVEWLHNQCTEYEVTGNVGNGRYRLSMHPLISGRPGCYAVFFEDVKTGISTSVYGSTYRYKIENGYVIFYGDNNNGILRIPVTIMEEMV